MLGQCQRTWPALSHIAEVSNKVCKSNSAMSIDDLIDAASENEVLTLSVRGPNLTSKVDLKE